MKQYLRISNRTFFILLFLVCMLPKIYFITEGFYDFYLGSHIVLAQMSEDAGHIIVDPYPQGNITSLQAQINEVSDRMGLTSLLLVIKLMTGMPYDTLLIIPIGGFLMFLSAYYLVRLITSSKLLISVFVIFVSYDPAISTLTYNINTHAWAFPLFLIFIGLIYSKINEIQYSAQKSSITLLVFIAISSIYYTTEFLVVLFLLISSLIFYITSIITGNREHVKVVVLALFCMIFFFGLDPIFYDFFRSWGQYRENIFSDIVTVIGDGLLRTFDLSTNFYKESSIYALSHQSKIVTWVGVIVYILISIGPILLISSSVMDLVKRRKIEQNKVLMISLFFTTIAQFLIYLLFNAVSFMTILLISPIVTVFSLKNVIKNKKIRLILALLIIATVMIKLPINLIYEPIYQSAVYKTYDSGVMWAAIHLPLSDDILSDLCFEEKVLMKNYSLRTDGFYVTMDGSNNVYFLYSNTSGEVETFFEKSHYDYLILSDLNSKKFIPTAYGPYLLKPCTKFARVVKSSKRFELIYNDGYIFIYKFLR